MAGVLCQSGFWPGMVTTIHNGIDPLTTVSADRVARIRQDLGIAPNALVIGTAGRLVPVKGQADLVRAVALLKPRVPHVRLLVAGAGPLHGELVDAAARLGIVDTCVFTGHRADVRDLISAMDIFALPSLSEGIPMALLEAMSLGVPVVATRVGGIPEVIQHRFSGLLAPPGDAHALAEACHELARYPDWADEIGAAGQRVVREEYTRERAGRALLDTYRSLVRVGRAKRAASTRTPRGGRRLGHRIFGYPSRLIGRAVQRERMRQIRRDPAELSAALRSARSVLVVCHGNIIRSAFAAELLRQSLKPGVTVSVRSAGLAATPGRPAHPNAIAIAATRQVALDRHVSSPLAAELVDASDVIFVMEVSHLVELSARFPAARAKTFLMTCLAPAVGLEIPDPVNGELPVFQSCFAHLSDAVAPVAQLLSEAVVCR
jgi:protein-tyrosine-phosphatase